MKSMNLDCCLILYAKGKSKWKVDLIVKSKIIKPVTET